MHPNTIKSQAELHLGKGELAEALDLLIREVKSGQFSQRFILLSSQFHDMMKSVQQGQIQFDELPKRKNQLAFSLLETLQEFAGPEAISNSEKPALLASLPVYLSVGKPHNDVQSRYLDRLKAVLAQERIQAETLGTTFWTVKKPLIPIQKRMTEVAGCVVLAMERFYAVEGLYKRGSSDEKRVEHTRYPTPWAQIEAAMAYQIGMPLLILKDRSLVGEGMFDPSTHDWLILEIDPEKPEELDSGMVNALLKSWADEVRAYYTGKK